jgi:TM2 domain-containing membrane protein YozV
VLRFTGFFVLLFLGCLSAKAQTSPSFDEEMKFMQHLVKQKQYANVVLLGTQLRPKFNNSSQKSRLALEIGMAYRQLEQPDSATQAFGWVTPDFEFYNKAKFYQSLSLINVRRYAEALQALDTLPITNRDSLQTELRQFQQAGIALLQQDYRQFDKKSQAFSFQYAAFASQERKLLSFAQKLKKMPRRSPFVAGVLSAIVPGTGKIYAGKTSQGLNMLFQNLFLGAQATEALIKDGVASPRFIIYGALFSFFYIGNIWGSVLSVKMQQREVYETIRHEVLFNLDVPLRLVFQ